MVNLQAINRRAGVGGNFPPEAHRFKPGQSGNPSGRPKGTSLTARLRKILDEVEDGKTVAQRLMEAGVEAAKKGDFRFWNAIFERMEGKVPDHLATQGEVEVIIRHVDESNQADD